MPELNLAPQLLCEALALQEAGDAVLFEVQEWGKTASAFAVRYNGMARAYLNRCAHVPTEMDWQPGKFWDMDKRYIICSVHGALYDPPSGHCVLGPCRGANLQSIQLSEDEGKVYWYPNERYQPVF